MNPLTQVKNTQKINKRELALGISDEASWHAKYKDSAYVYVGGIPFDLTEGDLLAILAQYGEIVDVNLVRDKGTGKSKGFASVAYEDQRSAILAVDNLNGTQVLGRTIKVDHVVKYKKKEGEDEEAEQKKREAQGVCRAFQKANAPEELDANFHMMNNELQTLVGELMRTEMQNGNMTNTRVQRRMEWSYLRGGLTTINRDYGMFNSIHHDISTHVIHHPFLAIPHYHLLEAPSHYREPSKSGPIPVHLFKILASCMTQDHYAKDDGEVVFYDTDLQPSHKKIDMSFGTTLSII